MLIGMLSAQIGTYSMDTTLLKYGAKDHFFKAALCHFCVDMLNCKVTDLLPSQSENFYNDLYVTFCFLFISPLFSSIAGCTEV